jgi:hypothetical protein
MTYLLVKEIEIQSSTSTNKQSSDVGCNMFFDYLDSSTSDG